MKTKERDIVYGRKYITLKRGCKEHKLFQEGIFLHVLCTIRDIEDYKGSILDPNVDFNGIDDVKQTPLEMALAKMYSKLSDLDDLLGMRFGIGMSGDPEWSMKLSSWCQRYNDVAKEFSRVYKTKVKVFRPWWKGV